MRRGLLFSLTALLLGACSQTDGDSGQTLVGSVYPFAFAAERMVGPDWDVIDLTPPGVEAHDLDLSLEQRSSIEDADVVVYLGDIGFQPQVESAVAESDATVIALADELIFEPSDGVDPHIWLDAGALRTATTLIANETGADSSRVDPLRRELVDLEESYRSTLSLTGCRYRIALVTHEAFGYVLGRYGFRQVGLSGLTPEAEPTAEKLAEARELIESGKTGAIFYEEHEDAKETAESFAADAGVPALPLSTLESEPAEGDYFTVMEDNLESLREGLQCQ